MGNNQRLKELKLAFYINHIEKSEDKNVYTRVMKILSSLVGALGKEEHDILTKITMQSVGGNLINASKKEIVATAKTYFSNMKAAKLLGISNATFYNRYNDLLSRNFINKEFMDSLKPMFASDKERFVVDFVLKFIENFKFATGNDDAKIEDNDRSLELEFWLIYDKMMNIIQNSIVCDKFMFNVCNLFDIDYNDIAQLKNNVHIISRQYPHFRYNNRYFMQELVYLFYEKGLTLCQIATKVLGKKNNFLYIGTNKEYTKLIDSPNVDWQYAPTIDWSRMNKYSVLKFIELFHTFINYGF